MQQKILILNMKNGGLRGPIRQFIFKRNTPQLAAAGIKCMRIQHRFGSANRVPFSCGGASDAPQLATWNLLPVLFIAHNVTKTYVLKRLVLICFVGNASAHLRKWLNLIT
jgi:hypothetical protein